MSDAQAAVSALEVLFEAARERVRARVVDGGKIAATRLDAEQMAAHAIAYWATELEAARQLTRWAESIAGEAARHVADAYVAEFFLAVAGGIDLGQTERVGLAEIGLGAEDVRRLLGGSGVSTWAEAAAGHDAMMQIAREARHQGPPPSGLSDETLVATQKEFRRFVDREVLPVAQEIHRKDVLVPMDLVHKMSELGVFGLTVPESFGGLGLGKVAMCVVTEELSRGYIGVGSLGTRAEIAAELISQGGTSGQKEAWLPRIASGAVLPTAVFTEPNHGSDLAHIQTRAVKGPSGYTISGQKTWITHACRADLMTLLARTDTGDPGYGGLSMFLAPKTRTGEPGQPEFVDRGLTGTEIKVLGYRGMKEYELSFDGFEVPPDGLLGEAPGQGFKQLMATFESARIQTAARGVGIAQAALEVALGYAESRIQFGRPIADFPRVARKIARMVCRTQAARQLAYFSARMKDSGKRCDLEAGMAKLLATRAAWESADACVQIHGGNGYAEEYTASRLLVDARVLSIFEGANEIQAHVVARRLLEQPPQKEQERR